MPLKDKIESVRTKFLTDLESFPDNPHEIESLRIKYLGRKGLVADLFQEMNNVTSDKRPAIGQALNELKREFLTEYNSRLRTSDSVQVSTSDEKLDTTLPGKVPPVGSVHILEQTLNEIKDIFISSIF